MTVTDQMFGITGAPPISSTPESRSALNADKANVRARLQVCSHGFGIDVIRGDRICRSCGQNLGTVEAMNRTLGALYGGKNLGQIVPR